MESKISSFSIACTISESQRILFTTDKPDYRELNLKKRRNYEKHFYKFRYKKVYQNVCQKQSQKSKNIEKEIKLI